MLGYLISLLGFVALCVCWVLFQRWLAKHDPDQAAMRISCGSCGEGQCQTKEHPEQGCEPGS